MTEPLDPKASASPEPGASALAKKKRAPRSHKADEQPESVIARIRWSRPYLNPALRRIAEYILKNPEQVKSISIKDLALLCQVSESTITRFVRDVNVVNFQQLKIRIAEELSKSSTTPVADMERRHVYEDISPTDDTSLVVDKISGRYIKTISDTMNGLNTREVERAVDAINACDFIVFFALGSSNLAAENAIMRFMRVGKTCQFFHDFTLRQISATTLNERSLAIGISNSGRTITTTNALKEAKARGATTICITSFPESPIVSYADIKLFTPTVNAALGSADYHESMVSKIAQLHVIDVLYSCFAVRNYDKSIDALERSEVYATSTRE
ncbi:RpiR family transcriptional regulator [Roseiarcus fermentans]|uniref:RpiR family transcriptional regulator n=1 Tax=Roseiarcus fermentans TaxID=1473586 RepID=A0A366FVR5_9HYPH|nr:MurR/RpiR family transcriptional regulator [Roseiarcus fermentans]RBP18130.1 RpiR family transcriptional regulator [Roseiarcus fermentans]